MATDHARTRKAQPAIAAGIVTLKIQNRIAREGAKLEKRLRAAGFAHQKNTQNAAIRTAIIPKKPRQNRLTGTRVDATEGLSSTMESGFVASEC